MLEHGYLTRVERPHGLPRAGRQVRERTPGGPVIRDASYDDYGVIVELDGRADHTSAGDRDRDLERDLAVALDGRLTVRLGWGQVFDRPCRTAERVAGALRSRGWRGDLTGCSACLGWASDDAG